MSDAATCCSQCSVSAPPILRKSGLARRLKHTVKNFSMLTKAYSYCSSSGTLLCCLSKVRFSLALTGDRYRSWASVLVMSFSAVNLRRRASKSVTPSETMKGFRRSILPWEKRAGISLAVYFLMLHFFAPSPFNGLTEISLSVKIAGAGALVFFRSSAAASSCFLFSNSLRVVSILSTAVRTNINILGDIFFSCANSRRARDSFNDRSNSSLATRSDMAKVES
mmetsp:Transcript_50814/g.106178  ORF Transcript_50814/g.106178 Transcript_50814/m.106178 type:complete len:223 (+) Transcript_50814:1067-1735(+)